MSPRYYDIRNAVLAPTSANCHRIDARPSQSPAAEHERTLGCVSVHSRNRLLFQFVSVAVSVCARVKPVDAGVAGDSVAPRRDQRGTRTQTETSSRSVVAGFVPSCWFSRGFIRLFQSTPLVSGFPTALDEPPRYHPRYRTTKSPRRRMSFDDEPISTRNVPGSTIQCMSRSSICNCSRPTEKTTSLVSPGARWMR